MPASSTCHRYAALALAVLATVPGCRAFRCQKVSDEAIALTRQLSLEGLDAQQRGQWEQAELLFAAAVAKCPHDERARCGYSESLWRRGAKDEAVVHMEQAVRLSGHDPERLVQLGHMYRELGDLARAGQQAERAIAANPQLAAAWALRGEVERARGERTLALASFHRALSLQPQFPPVQLAAAEIHVEENRPQRALATLQSLAASYPAGQVPPDLLLRESRALAGLGRHLDASRRLAAAAERGNPPPELLRELAKAQAHAGDLAAARQTLVIALARHPQHPGCVALAEELGAPPATIAAAVTTEPPALH